MGPPAGCFTAATGMITAWLYTQKASLALVLTSAKGGTGGVVAASRQMLRTCTRSCSSVRARVCIESAVKCRLKGGRPRAASAAAHGGGWGSLSSSPGTHPLALGHTGWLGQSHHRTQFTGVRRASAAAGLDRTVGQGAHPTPRQSPRARAARLGCHWHLHRRLAAHWR